MDRKQLVEQIFTKKTFLCVGLDTDLNKVPHFLLKEEDPIYAFNKAIIEKIKNMSRIFPLLITTTIIFVQICTFSCLVFWSPCFKSSPLMVYFHIALRMILQNPNPWHVTFLIKPLQWFPITLRIKKVHQGPPWSGLSFKHQLYYSPLAPFLHHTGLLALPEMC